MSGLNGKQNAKEYLKVFAASQDIWLKALIYDAIETNGDISEERKDKIFNNLSTNANLIINEPNIINDNSDIEIYISELSHKSGVNALKENQTIKFNKDVTILYGLNGAGKSSYFKVLNEIVGGNQKKDILSNIYSETTVPIKIELSFEKKGEQPQAIHWDGSNRSIDFLNKCKVFDTSYLSGLLETRKADTTLIQPLGLNLFTYLVELVDGFKNKLYGEADKKRLIKPILEYKYLNDNIKISFENHQINEDVKKQIENLYVFSDEKSQELKKVQKELSDLTQINIQDKIKLKTDDKNELNVVENQIEITHTNISNYIKKIQETLIEFSENKEANKLAKEQFSTLSNIPASDTEEWKEFIKAGKKYSSKIENSEGICVYCYQPLKDENTINLVKAYGSFLRGESEQNLNKSIKSLDSLIKQIDEIPTKIEIKENIKPILKELKIGDINESLFDIISNTNNDFNLNKKQLLEKLNSKYSDMEIVISDVDDLVKKLILITNNIQTEIDILSEENSKKPEKIDTLEKLLNKLLQNESISKQKEEIKTWFEINISESELRKKASKINTNKISTLSKTAHNDLLTENLKQNFSNELSYLGYKNLDVKIENSEGGGKGTSSTKLTLSKNKGLRTVLSEGEQKAVALALFIAESKI